MQTKNNKAAIDETEDFRENIFTQIYIDHLCEAAEIEDADCIIVLGCLVKSNGEPSDMLFDRLERGVEIYTLDGAPKILMSGDHGRAEYDEVGAMKEYAVSAGVPSEDVFLDHAGFSTYESMYRAKEIFGVQKAIIVTQGYHLYRALYIAESFGIEAYGVASDQRTYVNQIFRDVREALARGDKFLNVDLKKSDATAFLPENGRIRMPFNSLPGLGETAAEKIIEARDNYDIFSVEELRQHTGISKTVVEILRRNHVLDGLSETNQFSLF